MTTTDKAIILIIDDETAILQTLKSALEDEDYIAHTLNRPERALNLIGKLIPDVVLLDIFMPDHDGVELLAEIKQEYPTQKVVMISGFGNIPLALKAIKNGAVDFIEKPLNLDEILAKLALLTEDICDQTGDVSGKASAKTDVIQSRPEAQEPSLVGKSYTFLELLRQAKQIAPLDLPVLIQGEVGVGKTTIAALIAGLSEYTKVNIVPCAQLKSDEQIKEIDSAFSKKQATVLVHHVEELSNAAQQTLLSCLKHRALDEPRLIATTTTSLFALSREHKFNMSLFQALNVVPLEVPPLRKHAHDIPLLVDHFLTIANEEHHTNIVLNTAAMRQLRNHAWPANIAELQAAVNKIVLLAPEKECVVTPEHLLDYLGERDVEIVAQQTFASYTSFDDAKLTFEKRYLTHLVKKNHYNLEAVSHYLQIDLSQLKNKLIELHVPMQPGHG